MANLEETRTESLRRAPGTEAAAAEVAVAVAGTTRELR
jgi:hypothetical protein